MGARAQCDKFDNTHIAAGAAQQLPVHEALGGQEAAPEAQEAVEVAPLPLQHADQQPIPCGLRHDDTCVATRHHTGWRQSLLCIMRWPSLPHARRSSLNL